ncbi:hypothetical protein QZH56_13725 [Streptomyces olivoreticuli]|uniref:hypothetical protein n=1 Tax=Streptomyces olivoreticuli TaxID=68246 RepID=UPI002659C819|nr:hypothetical protein [Streptomyces olivoreticuli]WKK26552.1 hypothetical protein QZH56_13725 [Streptomyces olivoreticuli]
MTDLALAAPLVARRAADDLFAIREQWGDLLAAIDRPPAEEWPPRERRGFLDQLATAEDDERSVVPVVGRVPLTLRQHPAPLNLDALDATLDAERTLFGLADLVAAAVQRPIRPARTGRRRYLPDQVDAANPARWHYPAPTSPGSRAYGLHWAAVWLEGRALGEPGDDDLFAPMSARLLDEVAATVQHARRTVERALGRDGRKTTLDTPCPWCGGQLVGRARPGGQPTVACSTGPGCGAPVLIGDRGQREWRGADLVDLWAALEAARRHGTAS